MSTRARGGAWFRAWLVPVPAVPASFYGCCVPYGAVVQARVRWQMGLEVRAKDEADKRRREAKEREDEAMRRAMEKRSAVRCSRSTRSACGRVRVVCACVCAVTDMCGSDGRRGGGIDAVVVVMCAAAPHDGSGAVRIG